MIFQRNLRHRHECVLLQRRKRHGFYKAIGVSANGMGSIIGRAKKLRRDGFPAQEFKEIKIAEAAPLGPCQGIEIAWENGKLIRFQQVDQLVDFLKKVAA